MIIGNEPAYPSDHEWTEGGKDFLDAPVICHRTSFGLTKREYFSAMALSGLCANSVVRLGEKSTASKAVEIADALISELNK